jgi:hypothetical protein
MVGLAVDRIALEDGWSMWRWAVLRATGFPARGVLALASDELAVAADGLVAHDDAITAARDELIAACRAVARTGDPARRPAAQRTLKRSWQHRIPDPIDDPDIEPARARLAAAIEARPPLAAAVAEAYERARHANATVLREVGGDDRFRQALLWQNPSALRGGVDWLRRRPVDATDAETRNVERRVASYVQRYCVKNDTIGFFGPIGWARFGDAETAIAQRPGPELLAERIVYFEYWGIDALAAKLAEDPALRPFLVPRLLPRFRLDGTTVHHPIEQQAELPPELAAVAARCDGERTARAIAHELVGAPGLELAGETDVLDALDELTGAKLVTWTLEIPTAVTHPDRALAALLARIEDPAVRARAEVALAELRAQRDAVAAAADSAQLAAALAAFDAAFTAATGAETRRAHGQTYAGRTPLYEDCRRDLDVELGRPIRDRLARPLALLLQSARWYTYEIAARYRRALGAIHRDCGGGRVDFARFWDRVPALFPGPRADGSIVAAVRTELRARWARVVAIDPAERTVHRRAAALAGEVARAFAAPHPGWPAARHHSPDLMIAGDLLIVGELHTGFNTVMEPLFVKHHAAPDDLIAARDADVDRTCIAPTWSKAITRADYYSMSPRDLDLETGITRSARPRSHVLSAAQLVVEERAGFLEVATRDGAHRFDIIAFLEHHLIAESYSAFSPVAPGPHTPRIAIDDVVIARESWHPPLDQLGWVKLDDPAARFMGCRIWRHSLGLPRHFFIKTPEETKPVFIDTDSPIFVELLAKQLRNASAVAFSEMLPTIDDSWVLDARGERYTAELRLAAVDPIRWESQRCLDTAD